jgi:hypothetical protein
MSSSKSFAGWTFSETPPRYEKLDPPIHHQQYRYLHLVAREDSQCLVYEQSTVSQIHNRRRVGLLCPSVEGMFHTGTVKSGRDINRESATAGTSKKERANKILVD